MIGSIAPDDDDFLLTVLVDDYFLADFLVHGSVMVRVNRHVHVLHALQVAQGQGSVFRIETDADRGNGLISALTEFGPVSLVIRNRQLDAALKSLAEFGGPVPLKNAATISSHTIADLHALFEHFDANQNG